MDRAKELEDLASTGGVPPVTYQKNDNDNIDDDGFEGDGDDEGNSRMDSDDDEGDFGGIAPLTNPNENATATIAPSFIADVDMGDIEIFKNVLDAESGVKLPIGF